MHIIVLSDSANTDLGFKVVGFRAANVSLGVIISTNAYAGRCGNIINVRAADLKNRIPLIFTLAVYALIISSIAADSLN